MDVRKIGLYVRHIQEGGALFAKFLNAHPEIDPNFADDLTDEQDSTWKQYSFDLTVTQQIERNELNIAIDAEKLAEECSP